MATFVLVHGAGHGGWCYAEVARRLRAAGHEAHAPTLTGLGERAHLLRPDVDLETHIADVVAVLECEDLRDVVLVGHSYGGMVVTGVADRAAARIRELVYLDAAHPRDGEAMVDILPDQVGPLRDAGRIVDGVEQVLWPFPGLAAFYGVIDPTEAARVDALIRPHPWATFAQPLRLLNGNAATALPRTNINCEGALFAAAPEWTARQHEGERNFEVACGHNVMLADPAGLADLLIEIAAHPARRAG